MGRTIVFTPITGSTNDDALRLAGLLDQNDSGYAYPSGTLVLCETQTGGRGRLGRQWVSPAGGIFMSLILRPDIPLQRVPELALVAGYAVASAIRRETGLDAKVKWPNDVLAQSKKICGVLCEAAMTSVEGGASTLSHVVAGIGINADQREGDFPEPVRHTASSIRILTGRPIDRNTLIASVMNEFEKTLEEFVRDGLSAFKRRLTEISAYLGEIVTLKNTAAGNDSQVTGIFRGVGDHGQALIEIPGEGVRSYRAGDLTLRKSQPTPATSSSARLCRPPGSPFP